LHNLPVRAARFVFASNQKEFTGWREGGKGTRNDDAMFVVQKALINTFACLLVRARCFRVSPMFTRKGVRDTLSRLLLVISAASTRARNTLNWPKNCRSTHLLLRQLLAATLLADLVGLVVAAGRALAAVVLLLATDAFAAALAFLLFGLIGNERSTERSVWQLN
jgi:hypothetical protein